MKKYLKETAKYLLTYHIALCGRDRENVWHDIGRIEQEK